MNQNLRGLFHAHLKRENKNDGNESRKTNKTKINNCLM